MSAPLAGSKHGYDLKKLRYSHDAMIDALIENPAMKQYELATMFGVTKEWISMLMCSDAFQARLAARKADVIDPIMAASFKQRMEVLARKSVEVLMEKLDDDDCGPNVALGALGIAAKGFGFGGAAQVNVDARSQTQFVVAMPGKAQSSLEWAAAYGARELDASCASASELAVPPPPPGILLLTQPDTCAPQGAMDTTPPIRPVGHPIPTVADGQEG
jgi:hypothetical protein